MDIFDFGRDRDGMDLKTAVSGRDWSGWDFLGIFSRFFGIFRVYEILFFLSILWLSSTLTCILALTPSPSFTLNEYEHSGHFLSMTLFCTHFMCLGRSTEQSHSMNMNTVGICCPQLCCAHSLCVLTYLKSHSMNTNTASICSP
jgi:hypothetical protein